MRASLKWLQEIFPVDADVDQVAERLTAGGIEVEAIEHKGRGLENIVVAEVRGKRAHPKRDRLSLVTLFDGRTEQEVVCGADNVPDAGGRVLFSRLGATLPGGFTIESKKIGGVVSEGMICSETELDIGTDTEGIVVLGPTDPGKPGQEIAEVFGLDDVIFELGLTPNRPDWLGHIGLARELAVLLGKNFEAPTIDAPARIFDAKKFYRAKSPLTDLSEVWSGRSSTSKEKPDLPSSVAVDIVDPDRCPRYGAALVTGVTVGPSPLWLRYRLHLLGLRSLSNIVDATNLVLLEYGHPIHGFDLRRVRGARIEVRLAKEGETMATLDGVERTFTADDLLICDGEGPVAVAGVMGGQDSEIVDETSEVLIECAYFDPRSIRRTSRRLGLSTDSSHRFERGVDPGAVTRVLARAATLIAELGGGTVAPLAIDAVGRGTSSKPITFRQDRASRLLGIDVEQADAIEILRRLGCDMSSKTKDQVVVTPPSWRPDLGREVDLIEEVARVRGYDEIPTVAPRVRPSEAGTADVLKFADRLRAAAAGAGLHEAINYSFVSAADLKDCRVPTEAVTLSNPLSEERSVMRTSLLPGLLAAAANARRHQVQSVSLFEIGHTFHPSGDVLPEERATFALLLTGTRDGWIGVDGALDFYDGKGALEATLQMLLSRAPEVRLSDTLDMRAPYLHPKRRAEVLYDGQPIGCVGEVHPEVTDALSPLDRVVYAEIAIAPLHAVAVRVGAPQAGALPRFPAVTRDIAMLVAESYAAGEIASALEGATDGLAESVTIFDLYKGDQIPAGQRSLAFRVVYRNPEATLTDKQVDKVHAKLKKIAQAQFGATIR